MVRHKEVMNNFQKLQESLNKRTLIVTEMKAIMEAQVFNAKKYYSLAKEYKALDIITRQMELEIIGLCT